MAPPYGPHDGPPSIRTSVASRPTGVTPPSAAANEIGVVERTYVPPTRYFGSPTARVVVGGVSSTTRVAFATASTFPAKSSLDHSTRCGPSPANVKEPVAV